MLKKIVGLGLPKSLLTNSRNIHLAASLSASSPRIKELHYWKGLNDVVFPPQLPSETPRPAFICHSKENIKYSYKKLWYIACLIRGMSIDNALKQLSFVHKKGAVAIKETLLEAQQMAVEDHNVEFRTNLWVSESFVGKGIVIKGMRRHARGRMGEIRYNYTHYFLKLEEGSPPEHYYPNRRKKTSDELLNEWLDGMRKRRISSSL